MYKAEELTKVAGTLGVINDSKPRYSTMEDFVTCGAP
jgi:hypothetical protein